MDKICPGCGAHLPPAEDAGTQFCAHCGLQQLRMAEDAIAPANAEVATAILPKTFIDWPAALKFVALAAVIGAGLPALLPWAIVSGSVGGIALLLMPLLSAGVLSLYRSGRPPRLVSTTVGSRLGAALGLLCGVLTAFETGAVGFVLRYSRHSRAVENLLRQNVETLLKGMNPPGGKPPEMLAFFRSPEFLAGSYLLGFLLTLVILVLAGTMCGWAAGMLLGASRKRVEE